MEILAFPGSMIIAGVAYWLAWRAKAAWLRRTAMLVLALMLAVAAFVGTFGYAFGLSDLRDPRMTFADALGGLVLWAICLGAWFLAFRFGWFIFRLPPRSSSTRKRTRPT
jgi:hypothetical protein